MKEINCPAGAQLMMMPMMSGTIAAGFKNKKYQEAYKFPHYGVDFDSRYGEDFKVVASGSGTVIGVEKNLNNSLGCICVIQYDNVYNPTTKKVESYVFRYYHMAQLYVKKGDKVKTYDQLGQVINHKWWNHVHVEIDSDIKYPFYTPQVAEKSSALLVRRGATDSSLLNPMSVLVVGRQQSMMVHNLAIYADHTSDAPRFVEGLPAPTIPTKPESQPEIKPKPQVQVQDKTLPILPINDAKLTCGYKNPLYYQQYGIRHYGCDLVSVSNKRGVYASADGKVIAAGWDGTNTPAYPNGNNSGCGYVLIIVYPNIKIKGMQKTGATFTYLHLKEQPVVKVGSQIKQGQLLGYYGDTGSMVFGAHLHLQIDTDTKYPQYCMGMGSGHRILKHGTVDSTVNPMDILYLGKNQSIVGGRYPAQYDRNDLQKLEKI